jgi:hypothetical protein
MGPIGRTGSPSPPPRPGGGIPRRVPDRNCVARFNALAMLACSVICFNASDNCHALALQGAAGLGGGDDEGQQVLLDSTW